MLCVPAYTHERRPYSATLYPTSFTLDSVLALTIRAQRKTMIGGTPGALWLVGDFSCDSSIVLYALKKRGGGLTRQPVGPLVGTATMTAVMSANRVDLGSFSSRCCSFRRTHTSADPIRTLYPTSFTLDSLLALTVSAQCKAYGWCSTPGPIAGGDFLT